MSTFRMQRSSGLLGFALGGVVATRDMREMRTELEAIKQVVRGQQAAGR